jgi:hypothetical protein
MVMTIMCKERKGYFDLTDEKWYAYDQVNEDILNHYSRLFEEYSEYNNSLISETVFNQISSILSECVFFAYCVLDKKLHKAYDDYRIYILNIRTIKTKVKFKICINILLHNCRRNKWNVVIVIFLL